MIALELSLFEISFYQPAQVFPSFVKLLQKIASGGRPVVVIVWWGASEKLIIRSSSLGEEPQAAIGNRLRGDGFEPLPCTTLMEICANCFSFIMQFV